MRNASAHKSHRFPRRRLLTIAIFLLAGAVVNVAVAWGCAVGTIQVRGGVFLLTLADHHWLKESDWKLRPEDDDFVWKPADRIVAWSGGATAIPARIPARIGTMLDRLVEQAGDRYPIDVARVLLLEVITGFGLERKGFILYPDVKPGQRGAFSAATFVVRERSGWPLRALQGDLWLLELDDFPDVPAPRWFFESRFAIAKVRVTNSWEGRMVKDDRLLAYLPILPGFAINTAFYAIVLWLIIPGPFALRRLIRRRRGLCPKCAYPMGESPVCSECGCKLPRPLRAAT